MGIVVPLANEEATLKELLARICEQIDENDRVFCVVDNASKDQTRACVEAYCEKNGRVQLVWAPENRSVVDAYFRGYREALAAQCDWILEMDGGFSHRPEEIPRFIDAMERGVEFAAGSRYVAGGSHKGKIIRMLISRGGTKLTNLLLGTRMEDMTSGFECFTHQALKYVVEQGVKSRAHFFQTEIRFMLHDWKWEEIPINYTTRSNSVGKTSLAEAFRNLWFLVRQNRQHAT